MTEPTELQALIQRLRSKHHGTINDALNEARQRGWLHDGSLDGALIYGAKWQGQDLRGAKLRGATLSGVVLQNANLTDADFSNSEMIDSDWRGAKAHRGRFVGVDAIAAKLSTADFTDADLSGVTLGNATLSFTKFHHTILEDVDFNNAILDNTQFSDVNLSVIRNLNTVRHYGPSAIDVQTFLQSVGVDDSFWRGTGLPETAIQHMALMRQQPDPYYNTYISYAYPDRFMAYQLQTELRSMGVRCWLHEHQIEKNVDFYHALQLGVRPDHRVIVIASNTSLQSWWIESELQTALAKELLLDDGQRTLLVMDIDGALANEQLDMGLRERLSNYPHHDFSAITDANAFKTALLPVLEFLQR